MNGFQLDTNICIAYFKAVPEVVARFKVFDGPRPCISEVTLAELKFGANKSDRAAHHMAVIDALLDGVDVLPISPVIDLFAQEKARLARAGTIISDFDLLIGTTAVHHGLVMVTNNTRHFDRIIGIKLEDWTK